VRYEVFVALGVGHMQHEFHNLGSVDEVMIALMGGLDDYEQ
jgi:hypothetical protein